jgi:hypothetical protein
LSYTCPPFDEAPSGFFLTTMSINKELNNLRNRIKQYELKPNHSDSYLIWMQNLEQAITATLEEIEMDQDEIRFMYEVQIQDLHKQIDANFEVIKKLALIIEAAGIQFPTIHQSLPAIKNYHLVAMGYADKINSFDPHFIKVSL